MITISMDEYKAKHMLTVEDLQDRGMTLEEYDCLLEELYKIQILLDREINWG